MKYLCLFLIAISISFCFNGKKTTVTLPDNHVEDAMPNLPESIEEAIDNETNGKSTTNQYTFEFSQNTYWDMNDLSYFLADTSVKSLRLWGGTFSDLSPLAELRDLEELSIKVNRYITNISPIGSLVNLKRLTLFNGQNMENMENIEALSLLVNLEYLELNYKDKYYKELVPLQGLETLKLYNGIAQELDVTYIAQLRSLKELEINLGSPNLINISKLGNLVNLERITIDSSGSIDLSWLPRLQKLTELELRRCKVDDISPLLEMPNLVEVNLHFSEIRDITPLLESKSIKKISGPIVLENNIDLYHLFRERGIEYYPHISNR